MFIMLTKDLTQLGKELIFKDGELEEVPAKVKT